MRHHHWYSVRHSIVQDGQTSAMAVRLANPQPVKSLQITSSNIDGHRLPSCILSIEELLSERAVTTAL
nr:hypothetical protein [Bifidobacterium breve]